MTLPGTRFLEKTLSMPLMQLPMRSVLFELEKGRVLVSPASVLSAEELAALGPLTDIVAPSLMHTAGMAAAAKAHPEARLWGPVGVREKHPELAFHGLLGETPWPHEDLQLHELPGAPKLREWVLLHPASKALHLSDLCFHVLEPRGPLTWLFLRLFGTYRRFALSRLFLLQVKDRAAFRKAIGEIARLDFEHVVPSHGAVLLDEGKRAFVRACEERGLL